MSTKLKTMIVAVIPTISIMVLPVSIVCLTVSLNPDVKWNEYKKEVFPGYYAYYYNTLWKSIDAVQYEEKVGTGNYVRILRHQRNDYWMRDIRLNVIKALGLTAGSLFLLIIALGIHVVAKEKSFVIISKFLSAVLGLIGGALCMQIRINYSKSIAKGILPSAFNQSRGGFYSPELEQMKLGYILVSYGGILTITVCSLLIVQCALYSKFAKGKWIWSKKTEVIPMKNDL